MIYKAYEVIEKYDMLKDVKSVLVGVSGGADSISLLHFLCSLSGEKNIKIIAAHVNHSLRGVESDKDEQFVKNFCKNLNIELFIKKADVKDLSKKMKISLEEAGREVRYDFFEELAKKFGAKIATAHTLSDSIETIILNLTRGTGLKGLCGIPPARENIIRPLIYATREEIEIYCKENNLKYITDVLNFSRDYTRNRIRLDFVSTLKKINPALERNIQKAILNFQEDENFLNNLTEKELINAKNDKGYNIEYIKNLPDAIKNRIIMKIIKLFSGEHAEQKHVGLVSKLINGTKTAVTLKNNVNIISKNGILTLQKYKIKDKINWEYKIRNVNYLTEIAKKLIIKTVSISEYDKMKFDNSDIAMWAFDFRRMPKGSVIRNRRVRDIFSIPKRNVTKTVKKLFNELKISESKRDSIPIIANENEVIWISGIGASQKYQPDNNTEIVATICEGLI